MRHWHRRWEFALAKRLLRGKRSRQLSLIGVMSVAGIALGVSALIVVLAVNTGFQTAFQDRILSTYPHLVAMRRGLDMNDWREVVHRVRQLPWVTQAGPATYDDMMLSSGTGRAGAVVRGVQAASLAALPPGLVVDGSVVTAPDVPAVSQGADGRWSVTRATAGSRYLSVVGVPGKSAPMFVHVLGPQAGLAGLLLVDTSRCDAAKGSTPQTGGHGGYVRLNQRSLAADEQQVVRQLTRRSCGALRMWETLPGAYTLEADGTPGKELVELVVDRTVVVILTPSGVVRARPPTQPIPEVVAAVSWVNLATRPLSVAGVHGMVAPRSASAWVSHSGQLPSIALGAGLAKRLGAHIGDEVRAISPARDGAGVSSSGVAGRFRVRSVLSTGFHDHDQRLALVQFEAAQRFLGRGDVARWVDARIDDPLLARRRMDAFRAAIEPITMADVLRDAQGTLAQLKELADASAHDVAGRSRSAVSQVRGWTDAARGARRAGRRAESMYRVIDWEEMNRNIFDAARLQKVAMSLFPFIIVLVAALNVVGTQAVVVHERSRDIAILRAMGASSRSVGAVFLMQGLAVGLWGTLIGLVIGGVCAGGLALVGYPLDPNVYLIDKLPVQLDVSTFLLSGGAATLLSFAAAWLSARRASHRAPVDGLRRLD